MKITVFQCYQDPTRTIYLLVQVFIFFNRNGFVISSLILNDWHWNINIHLPKNPQSDLLKKMIILSKSQIPAELRICNTFFTQISLIGNMVSSNGEQCVDPHVDKDDLFTAIIHFGNPKKGGNLIIYGGNNKKSIGKKMKTHPFKHGNVHFGTFMDVVHSVDPWWGYRGSFSLNMKKSMIDFFTEQGNLQRYSCYRKLNYPNDDHFIIN